MFLPIRTTMSDVEQVCRYLSKKPTGATIKEAKAAIGATVLDPRKLSAFKTWGLVEQSDDRIRITERGRRTARDDQTNRHVALREAIGEISPYFAVIERAFHRQEKELTAVDVAVFWHGHFPNEAGTKDKTLNDQAVCFFQILEGAGLGKVTIGRKGSPTRFGFNIDQLEQLLTINEQTNLMVETANDSEGFDHDEPDNNTFIKTTQEVKKELGQAIFIAHGKNTKPLEQLKNILDQFNIKYMVAVDEPNLGRPISSKVRELMEACNCAIFIFTGDAEFTDTSGEKIWRPSENVIYELGAASYLYGKRIVILKEARVKLPSDFSDLGYIIFDGDQLDAKSMEIFKELVGFGILKVEVAG